MSNTMYCGETGRGERERAETRPVHDRGAADGRARLSVLWLFAAAADGMGHNISC